MTDKPPAWEPQFRAEGAAWVRMVLETEDSDRRLRGYASTEDVLLGEILRYGALGPSGTLWVLLGAAVVNAALVLPLIPIALWR